MNAVAELTRMLPKSVPADVVALAVSDAAKCECPCHDPDSQIRALNGVCPHCGPCEGVSYSRWRRAVQRLSEVMP